MYQSKFYEYLKGGVVADIVIVKDDKVSQNLADVARFCKYEPFILPDFRAKMGDDLRSFKDELSSILTTLNRYYHDNYSKKIIITTLNTITKSYPKIELFKQHKISFGDKIDLKNFKNMLYFFGYEFVDIVEDVGEVSIRGDIIDIYSPNLNHPVRISLFDDECESIRYFDEQNQKSFEGEVEFVTIFPALFGFDENMHEDVLKRVEKSPFDSFFRDIHSLGFWYLEKLSVSLLENFSVILLENLKSEIDDICYFDESINSGKLKSLKVISEAKKYKDLVYPQNIKEFLGFHEDKKITILASNVAILKQHEVEHLNFIESNLVVNLISSDEIILSLNKKQKSKAKKAPTILVDDLKVGDFVVHEEYGIGLFEEIRQIRVLGGVRDFIALKYLNDDVLLLPVENLHLIDRYIGGSSEIPILDKLGKGSFAKLKEKVKDRLFAIAGEIVNMHAKRALVDGIKIEVDDFEISQFQQSANFEYTKDQIKAVSEILSDLQSGKVMDRLLSADVGFGKTEVCMNAMVAVCRGGYQVCMVVPTTLLSNQHFKSISQRLSHFGFKIAKIDRYTTPKEKKEIVANVENGTIDILIGTHAIFGVKFKNLALLVIDEEHKFGVKQKETLKNISADIHLLSMSATPIPRSLNLALSSIKGLSQILTPPENRVGVRTYVKEQNNGVVKEAILRELRRGGQVFYIFNKIASIEQKKEQLLKLLPNLKILILHSQISAVDSEKEIIKFENREYDLLLSTSIVESGIHMPQVNTILVDNANNFGMADLHQLRGRVGRENKEGFCYYLVEDKEKLTIEAKKRLIALESNSFLGSGTVLAYHDLEIRGGGNIIGEDQSGHIKHIGYSLYLKMLEDTINKFSKNSEVVQKECDIKLTITAYISSEVVSEDRLRLELYRRLSKCKSAFEVREIEGEMIDRFGKLDTPTKQFLELIVIKILAISKGIK
ncbi:MAG: transcription-repair coupling factor, partial [Campylobacterales bacterium]|nr:transcription-repair coupling factor [Campylobacterales bacterium]